MPVKKVGKKFQVNNQEFDTQDQANQAYMSYVSKAMGAKTVQKTTDKTGTYKGKSNKLGSGGRAQQLKDKGVPEGVIGAIARKKQAAPGQKNFHK